MTLKIVNKTYYNNISVKINDFLLPLKKGENIINNLHADFKLSVIIGDKNKVRLYWLDVLIFGFLSDDSICAHLNCSSMYDVFLTGEECTIVLEEISAFSEGGSCKYNSVYLETDFVTVKSAKHNLNDFAAQRKRFIVYEIVFAGLLPVIVALLVLFIISLDYIWLILTGLWLLLAQFAFRRAAKVNQCFNSETANAALNEAVFRKLNSQPQQNKKGFFKKLFRK